jgi:hypothetical protein
MKDVAAPRRYCCSHGRTADAGMADPAASGWSRHLDMTEQTAVRFE